MMNRFNQFFTFKSPYHDTLTEQRAIGLLHFLASLTVLSLVASVYELLIIIQGNSELSLSGLLIFTLPMLSVLFFQMVRNGYYRQTAIALIVTSLVAVLVGFYPINTTNSLYWVLPLLAAAALLGWRTTLTTAGILFIFAVVSIFSGQAEDKLTLFILISIALIIITLWTIIFGTNIQTTARRFIREFEQLRRVTQNIQFKESNTEEELAFEAINLIRDQLNFTFASVYLVEDTGRVHHVLGGLNRQQINTEHNVHLQLGNGINEAIRTASTVQLNSESSTVLREHLLQGTLAALAIPIVQNNITIGVLDAQSEDVDHFTENEIETTNLIATSLATRISQARLISTLEKDVQEQERLLAHQRERLLNYERSEQRATTSAWVSYLQQRGIEYMGFDLKGQSIESSLKETMNVDLQTAIKTGDISVVDEGEIQLVRVPITLRGQSLGAMSFRIPKGTQAIGARQQELIRSVVQRLALALENKRLFEQSNAQAQRESKANEVGSLLLSTTDVETVLQLAADNFKEALGAIQTQIHLRPEASQIIEGEDISS